MKYEQIKVKLEELTPLRVCKYCGLIAYSELDLQQFRKNKESVYGRENLCKPCYNSMNRHYGVRQKRWDGLVAGFGTLINCYFCREEVTDIEGRTDESLVIHSLDGDHENWAPENKVPAHNNCHCSFHNAGEKNPRYKGRSFRVSGEKTNEH